MAKATLPTNYRDDILNVSTEGKRKYRMNYNDDGTVSFVDVTPYDQEGSDFGAGDINATNEAVNQSFDKSKLIRDMDAINALTQEGYVPDALALKGVNDSLTSIIARLETLESQLPYKESFGFSGETGTISSSVIDVTNYSKLRIIYETYSGNSMTTSVYAGMTETQLTSVLVNAQVGIDTRILDVSQYNYVRVDFIVNSYSMTGTIEAYN